MGFPYTIFSNQRNDYPLFIFLQDKEPSIKDILVLGRQNIISENLRNIYLGLEGMKFRKQMKM